MRGKHRCWTGVLVGTLLAIATQPAWTQRRLGRQQTPTMPNDSMPTMSVPGPTLNRKMLRASYEQLQKDVRRLSELADDLEDEILNTHDEDILSLSGVKKAEEIEKLAKKIQSRMKNL